MIPIDARAVPGRRPALARVCLAGLLALAGCVPTDRMGDDIAYVAPVAVGGGPLVLAVKGDQDGALRTIATALRRAGFQIDNLDPAAGEVRATSRSRDLVTCGELTQSVRDTEARISGTAPLAAIFDASAPGGILRREVRVATEVTLRIAEDKADTATLDERQIVTLRRLTADGGTVLSSQTLAAARGEVMTFADGTVCTSSGALARMFR